MTISLVLIRNIWNEMFSISFDHVLGVTVYSQIIDYDISVFAV